MFVFVIKTASGKQFPVYGESFAFAERAAPHLTKEEVVSIEKAPSAAKLIA